MYYAALKPVPIKNDFPFVESHVRHPVTEEMLMAAGKFSAKPAPFFKLKDIHGNAAQIGGAGKKPQFVYFILKGCPCSVDAQPLFNRMYARYKDKVDFIGVISSGVSDAKDYAGENNVLNAVVSDTDKKIIHAYGAKQSVYSALVGTKGEIVKIFPGYSQSMLVELNDRLAQMTGTETQPFDAALAPKQYATGCNF